MTGWTVIRCLPELEGKPWSELAAAFLRALRPSAVRVVLPGEGVKTDAIVWRVTVYLTDRCTIERIEQEVEVDLPDGVQHGHDLSVQAGLC